MFVLSLSLYNIRNRGVFLLCKITNLLIHSYKKKGLQELIRRISQNQVEKVVVLYKDRLLRFGFELIEYIASLYKGKRANKAKKLIRELIQEETDGKSHKSNVDTKQCTEN